MTVSSKLQSILHWKSFGFLYIKYINHTFKKSIIKYIILKETRKIAILVSPSMTLSHIYIYMSMGKLASSVDEGREREGGEG